MGLSSCSNGVSTVALVLLFLSSTVLCDCSAPTLPPHSELRGSGIIQHSYPVGTVLRLSCIPGYEYIPGKRPSMTCSDGGTWTTLAELCQGKRCPVPHLDNGRIALSDDLRLGETATLQCNYGFRMIGEATLRCILRGGQVRWHRDVPFCEQIPCVRPGIISNGRYDATDDDSYVVGSYVRYRCDAKYSLIGKSSISCIVAPDGNNGQWDSPPPECKIVRCAKPRIQHGKLVTLYKPNYTYGDGVTFECNPHYTLIGSAWITCGADNTWKPSLPHCDKNGALAPLPPLKPLTVAPADVDEMHTTQRETNPTGGSGSVSGYVRILGIVFGIILHLSFWLF